MLGSRIHDFLFFTSGTTHNVLLSWVVNPNEFYVHLAQTRTEIDALQDSIDQIYCDLGKPFYGGGGEGRA